MNWIDSIREIQKARLNNRFVIFVGSGVSANSKIPTWGDLIIKFAEKIEYDNCQRCEEKKSDCLNRDCKNRYHFSQDEYLRIPEYYYLNDDSLDHEQYYGLIRDTLCCDVEPNSIDNMIFRIMPHHIITTNYDSLLERSKEINAKLYAVISKDRDMLSKNNEHYIIKMHGDLEDPTSIILKESDYIDYEQTHTLISTYIKSLLIDHTFLFIGYSLNDYNLKLIIGWINYFCKMHEIADRPHNFILQSEPPTEYEEVRLEKSNIFIVDTSTMPADIMTKTALSPNLESPKGQMLYAYLECIYNSELINLYIPLKDILNEKYQSLKSYSKISYEDLIHVYPLGRTEFKGTTLCFWEDEWYDKIEYLLTNDFDSNRIILNTFQRAGVNEIYCPNNNKRHTIPQIDDIYHELFQLYIDNCYLKVVFKVMDCSNIAAKVYYYHFFKSNTDEIDELLEKEAQQVSDGDYISILLYKMNHRLAKLALMNPDEIGTKEIKQMFVTVPAQYQNSVQYIEKIFHSMSQNQTIMEDLLHKHEDKFSYGNNTMYFEHSFDKIWSLKAYAYDYYFFFKQNFLIMDYFSEPKTYFSYYLRAILCSYSPVNTSKEKHVFGISNHLEPYPLGEIEVDILVKYTKSKDLLNWIKTYKIQYLCLEDNINIISKFIDYCESFSFFGDAYWDDQMTCFAILLSKLDLSLDERKKVSIAFVELQSTLLLEKPNRICQIFSAVKLFATILMTDEMEEEKSRLLETLLTHPIYNQILERYESGMDKVISALSSFVSEKMKDKLNEEIDQIKDDVIKCNILFGLRKILPMDQYKDYLDHHIAFIRGQHLFYFVLENYLPYNENVLNRYIDIIEKETEKRKTNPNARSFPDHLLSSIENCILLKLFGKPLDISKLEAYEEYSEHLNFLLHPKEFDYSKVDTNNYMWCNFFHHGEYIQYFKEHKTLILNNKLEEAFSLGFASANQQKIVFGILLNEDELWNYAE